MLSNLGPMVGSPTQVGVSLGSMLEAGFQRRLFPQIRPVFRHNLAVFDQYAPPGNHASVIEVIVADYPELGLMITVDVRIGNLLRLDNVVQLLLPILKSDREIGWPFGPPKEIEIIANALMLIERGHCAKQAILSFKRNRRILIDNGSLRRGARQRSRRNSARFLFLSLFRRLFREQIKFRFSKFKLIIQSHWQRRDLCEQLRLVGGGSQSGQAKD